ncbi:MAG: hypothetical protein Kow0027_04860 [Saprospiraceae bacterium]
MKKALFPIALVFTALSLFAQKEDNVWLFGGINAPDSTDATTVFDFSGGGAPAIFAINEFIGFYQCSSTISDKDGNLQLYSNGVNIYDDQHEIIGNGDEFAPSDIYPAGYDMPQGAIFFPFPGAANKYLYLHGEHAYYYADDYYFVDGCSPLTWSVIEKVAGEWEVTAKQTVLSQDTLHGGKFTGVLHGNGRDWWLIVPPAFGRNEFRKYLIDPTGIQLHDLQPIGEDFYPGMGQVAMSPDGNWLAYYTWIEFDPLISGIAIDLYRFDRCTGQLSDPLRIFYDDDYGTGGVAFSKSSRFLYVSHPLFIYQFDLWANDIAASRTTVAEWDGFVDAQGNPLFFELLKTAPDGRIYITTFSGQPPSRFMGIIEQPDSLGLACDVQQHSQYLPTNNYRTVPNQPFGFGLGAIAGSPCDTVVTAVTERIERNTSIYPNPTTSLLQVDFPAATSGTLRLLSISGVELRQWKVNGSRQATLYLDELPAGIYLLQVPLADGRTEVHKVGIW